MPRISDLALGAAARKPFAFDRKRFDGTVVHVEVMLQCLTAQEFDHARINAVRYVDSLDKDKTAGQSREDLLRDAETIEVLASAVRDPDDAAKMWATPMELRQILTSVEIGMLSKALEDHMEETGPIIRTMSEARFKTLYDAVVAEGNADPLVFCDSRTLKNFITTLVCQHELLRTANSSGSWASKPSDGNTPSAPDSSNSGDKTESGGIDEDAYEEILARLKLDLGLVPQASQ